MAMKKFDDWKSNNMNEAILSGTEKLAKLRAGATAFRRGQASMAELSEEENLNKMAKEIVGMIEPALKAKIGEMMKTEPAKGKSMAANLARHLKNEVNKKLQEILKAPVVN